MGHALITPSGFQAARMYILRLPQIRGHRCICKWRRQNGPEHTGDGGAEWRNSAQPESTVTNEGLEQCISKKSLLYDKNGEETL